MCSTICTTFRFTIFCYIVHSLFSYVSNFLFYQPEEEKYIFLATKFASLGNIAFAFFLIMPSTKITQFFKHRARERRTRTTPTVLVSLEACWGQTICSRLQTLINLD